MDIDEVLEVIERILPPERLGPVERLLLHQSWLGQTYSEMAKGSGYGSDYIKEVGSQLWQDLSRTLGERVTKKNLHLVLRQYQQNSIGQRAHQSLPELRGNTAVERAFSDLITASDSKLNSDVPLASRGAEGAEEAARVLPGIATGDEMYFPGGPVPLNSLLYINRPLEELIWAEISQRGCFVRLKAPRKMGKSSLLNRIIARARVQGYQTVHLDFQEADAAVFAELDKFLRWFCANISRQLNLTPRLDDYWDEEMGSKVNCKIYFEAYLLPRINRPVVLALNEVSRVYEHANIAQDFLPMLRFWHEQGKQEQTWQKLRLLIAHTTEIYVPLKLNQSPFNIGLAISLPPLTLEQTQDLAQRYGLDEAAGEEGAKLLAPLQAMVGGHPYLVSLALYHLRRGEMTLSELLRAAPTIAGIYSDHLREYLTLLQGEPQLTSALQQIVTADESVQLDAIAAYKLESMGIVQLEGSQAKLSCELYRLYFQEQLGKENSEAGSKQLQAKKQESELLLNTDVLPFASRRSFGQYLESEWQQWGTKTLSLILCEVDYFKFYNAAHGTLAGDACLQRIARTICDSLGDRAFVACYEEIKFVALLPHTDADRAAKIAENLREQVKALALAHDQSKIDGFPAPVITISVGVTTATPKQNPTTIIAAAEVALSQAKRGGCDRVSFSPVLSQAS